ncbi:helix-turn-helix domain-containing protein [Heliobacterium undosum]|uniref:Helix-turn-helix domain-containing protein n=2 Tax=Heliomicrobium undosum TaxID=121734 RepID=A0A845L835_9FIRM|nr:helix-turn-helix domain-containing protein [Heliomicrobium undosum]
MTQDQLAEKIRVKIPTISGYENNYRQPDNQKLPLIASVLNVSADFLLGLTDEPTPSQNKGVGNAVNHIESALTDDPELLTFFAELKEREDLQLLFKQVRPLPPDGIKKIIRIIKAIEDEEAQED